MNINGNNYSVTNSVYNRYSAFSKPSGDKDIASGKSRESTDGVIYDKESETSSKIYTVGGTLQGAKTGTSKSKYSGQEILDEIDKYISSGQFYAIHYNGKEHWIQGMKIGENGGPVGDKKELPVALVSLREGSKRITMKCDSNKLGYEIKNRGILKSRNQLYIC